MLTESAIKVRIPLIVYGFPNLVLTNRFFSLRISENFSDSTKQAAFGEIL